MSRMRNPPQEKSSLTKRPTLELEDRWDAWLQHHENLIAGMVLGLGFLARVRAATGIFLNPDEAQHFLVANRGSLALAYKSSLTLAHPPLLIIVLYFWRYLGDSEFALRMSSILTGILFCFVFYKWIAAILGRKAALPGLIFVCLLPPLVSLSAQVRQYSLLLLFVTLAAYLLEQALAEDSARLMLLFSISVYLAILSHYSALFFTASIGVYAALRLATETHRRRIILTWLAGQGGALALFIFFYRTHISKLKGSSLAEQATEGWLRRSYYHPGQDHLLLFVVGRTFGVFQFIFGHLAIGDVMGLCFVGGVILLFSRKGNDHRDDDHRNRKNRNEEGYGHAPIGPAPWQLAIFFLLPFTLNCAASLAGAYPYGGTRHSVFLSVFGVAAISFFITHIPGLRTGRSFAVVVAIAAAFAIFGTPHQPYMTRADQSRGQMEHSLAFIQQRIPPTTPLFVDVQTRLLLGYYLCRQQQGSDESPHADFEVLPCGEYQLITANLWAFSPETFPKLWDEMVRTYNLKPGDTVWVVQEGWGNDPAQKLRHEIPGLNKVEIYSFGRNLQFFELAVGQLPLGETQISVKEKP
jgi:hypothetical protein